MRIAAYRPFRCGDDRAPVAVAAGATSPRTDRLVMGRKPANRQTLPVQAKVSLARAGWRRATLPGQPRTVTHPELTTAPPRPEPLKLLPFGGAARCRASGRITTQDARHDKQWVMTGIAFIHFTSGAGFFDNPPACRGWHVGGFPGYTTYPFAGVTVWESQGSSFGGVAMMPRAVLSSIRAWPRRHRQCSSCKRDQAVAGVQQGGAGC